MPLPGNAMTPLGRRLSSSSLRRNGAARPCRSQSGLQTIWVDAVALGPVGGDPLDAGAAAMHEDQVAVLGARLVEPGDDGGRVGDVLAAGDGDQGALRQVGHGLAVLAGALEVAGVDGRRGEMPGLRDVTAAARAPDLAGLDAVGVGGGVAHPLEGVAAVGEVFAPGR